MPTDPRATPAQPPVATAAVSADHHDTGVLSLLGGAGPWDARLAFVLDTMREMSRQTDPQEMVRAYGKRMRQVLPSDRLVSLSRRGLSAPRYRITRSSTWAEDVNPWKSPGRLPMLDAGLFGRLIYGDEPVVIDELDVPVDDPAAEYFAGMRSLVAVPLFDQGAALNMVVLMRAEPRGFRRETLPEQVWMSNLFGRATQTLALSEELRHAYDAVDRELRAVADIQRSLLPAALPEIPGLDVAAHYQTSRRAGGDYYDFFRLPNGQWGILIADVSGHGTPAAVLMAITHSIAHTCGDPKCPPSRLLRFVNDTLSAKYTGSAGSFVTAFYGIYDPADGRLAYSNAGHPAPRIRRAGRDVVETAAGALGLPLGIEPGEDYADGEVVLRPGDSLLLYTDGITEARDRSAELFGTDRLDDVMLGCGCGATETVARVLAAVETFSDGQPVSDDRTLLAARVTRHG